MTPPFKLDAIKQLQHGKSLTQLAIELNLPQPSLLSSWLKSYQTFGIKDTKFTSINELKTTIDEYRHYYNYNRIKSKLKGLSPVKYRNLVQSGLIQPLATT